MYLVTTTSFYKDPNSTSWGNLICSSIDEIIEKVNHIRKQDTRHHYLDRVFITPPTIFVGAKEFDNPEKLKKELERKTND